MVPQDAAFVVRHDLEHCILVQHGYMKRMVVSFRVVPLLLPTVEKL